MYVTSILLYLNAINYILTQQEYLKSRLEKCKTSYIVSIKKQR